MPNELENAFATLSEETGRVRLDPPATVRRRGDRQRAIAVTTGAVAAALLVGGTIVGSRLVLAGPPTPHLTPQPAGSVTTSATPLVTSPSTPASSGPTIPKSIPAAAFLTAGDAPGRAKAAPQRVDGPGLPGFCGKAYRGDRAIQATQNLLFNGPDDPIGSTPKAAVYETVMVFRGEGAQAFMTNLKKAVRGCSTQDTKKNYNRGPIGVGDESLLIEQTTPATDDAGEPVPGALFHRFWVAVRVNDAVAFVSNTGWESVSAERADTEHLGARAGARLEDWRG